MLPLKNKNPWHGDTNGFLNEVSGVYLTDEALRVYCSRRPRF